MKRLAKSMRFSSSTSASSNRDVPLPVVRWPKPSQSSLWRTPGWSVRIAAITSAPVSSRWAYRSIQSEKRLPVL